jgi:hypothetical protein
MPIPDDELFRVFDTPVQEVLVRRTFRGLAKRARKMAHAKPGCIGEFVQRDRAGETSFDEIDHPITCLRGQPLDTRSHGRRMVHWIALGQGLSTLSDQGARAASLDTLRHNAGALAASTPLRAMACCQPSKWRHP